MRHGTMPAPIYLLEGFSGMKMNGQHHRSRCTKSGDSRTVGRIIKSAANSGPRGIASEVLNSIEPAQGPGRSPAETSAPLPTRGPGRLLVGSSKPSRTQGPEQLPTRSSAFDFRPPGSRVFDFPGPAATNNNLFFNLAAFLRFSALFRAILLFPQRWQIIQEA